MAKIKPRLPKKHKYWKRIDIPADETLVGFAGDEEMTNFTLILLKH